MTVPKLPKNVYERNFDRLVKLGIINEKGELQFKDALKLKSGAYMDLNLDYLGKDEQGIIIAMAHNFEQNGDIMADPDMQVRIIPEMHSIEALTYQLDSMGIYQEVYPDANHVNPKVKKELNAFLETWLKNLIAQGFKLLHEGIVNIKDLSDQSKNPKLSLSARDILNNERIPKKPTFRIDPSAKGTERRMLETFGGELKKKGWKRVDKHEELPQEIKDIKAHMERVKKCGDCGKEKETCIICGVSYCVDCEGLHSCEE